MGLVQREHLSDYLAPLLAITFSTAGMLVVWDTFQSPFILAVSMHCLVFAPVMVCTRLLTPEASNAYFRIRSFEYQLYLIIGVDAFRRVLGAVGWNRSIDSGRGYDRTRASVPRLISGTISSELGHLTGAGLIALVAGVAVVQQRTDLAIWLVVIAVPVHIYPILIQRLVRAKVARWTFD